MIDIIWMYSLMVLAIVTFLIALWCVFAILDIKETVAATLEIHNTVLERHSAKITALRESSFPRYADAVIPLGDCDTDEHAAHDAAVTDALAHPLLGRASLANLAQTGAGDAWQVQEMRGKGVRLPDPEAAPFFTQSAPEK